jgi:hypothetical protein
MTTTPIPSEASADSIQMYARTAGVLGLISIVAGGFGEAYVPAALVVSRDAAATAARIMTSESLFRWGFTAYLVEALCDAGGSRWPRSSTLPRCLSSEALIT